MDRIGYEGIRETTHLSCSGDEAENETEMVLTSPEEKRGNVCGEGR